MSTPVADDVLALLKTLPNLSLIGLHFHIGSQITDMSVFKNLCLKVNEIQQWFTSRNIKIDNLNLGGGLGVNYHEPDTDAIPDFTTYFDIFREFLKPEPGQQVHFELGRALVALGARHLEVQQPGRVAILEELRAAGEVSPHRGPDAREQLTAHELHIAQLAAEGLTNRQIGERMFLAEKTVKNYVSHLLAKLGLERRTQAAVLATELRGPALWVTFDRPQAHNAMTFAMYDRLVEHCEAVDADDHLPGEGPGCEVDGPDVLPLEEAGELLVEQGVGVEEHDQAAGQPATGTTPGDGCCTGRPATSAWLVPRWSPRGARVRRCCARHRVAASSRRGLRRGWR